MTVPEFDTSGSGNFFNVRYALYTLPAIAIFIAILPIRNIFASLIIIFFMIINSFLLILPLKEYQTATLIDADAKNVNIHNALNSWFKDNYDDGLVLASATTSDPIIFGTDLNMKLFITEGSGDYWKAEMKNPGKFAKWAIVANSKRDMVDKYINHEMFNKNFVVVKEYSGFRIYKRRN